MPCLPHPFRDPLHAALQRAERLALENEALRARLRGGRLDWIQWGLVGLLALCGIATVTILAAH